MTRRRGTPPSRMRSYRIVAERRDTPDVDRLAQLFIGMAMQRAKRERPTKGRSSSTARPAEPDEVESTTQEASG